MRTRLDLEQPNSAW